MGVALAPTVALAGLAWALQACCCGGNFPPKPGPPGSIAGQLLFPSPGKSQALAVYAVGSYGLDHDGSAHYAMTRIVPPSTTYVLAVPPGVYEIVARLDSDPLSSAGYTFDITCSTSASGCGYKNYHLIPVLVESQQTVGGIDIGDWGGPESQRVVWDVDVHGSPVLAMSSASPKSLPSRTLPSVPSPAMSGEFASTVSGARVPLPVGWREVKPPISNPNDTYFANEAVSSPLSLDGNGVWLTVRWDIGVACPSPDLRLATSKTRVSMQSEARTRSGTPSGTEDFYFEDPSGDLGVQPFTGYGLWGAGGHYPTDLYPTGDCIEFTFTAVTMSGLESNLAPVAAMLQGTTFVSPH